MPQLGNVHGVRGLSYRQVTVSTGTSAVIQTQRVELVRETVSLWQKGAGSAYPPPDTDTLALPFRFQLPMDLQPSCSFGGLGVGWQGAVRYALEVVGARPRLHLNRRVPSAFPVLPPDTQGADLRSRILADGWQGGWRTTEKDMEIRKGIWGDRSQVKATVCTLLIHINAASQSDLYSSSLCPISKHTPLTHLYRLPLPLSLFQNL